MGVRGGGLEHGTLREFVIEVLIREGWMVTRQIARNNDARIELSIKEKTSIKAFGTTAITSAQVFATDLTATDSEGTNY